MLQVNSRRKKTFSFLVNLDFLKEYAMCVRLLKSWDFSLTQVTELCRLDDDKYHLRVGPKDFGYVDFHDEECFRQLVEFLSKERCWGIRFKDVETVDNSLVLFHQEDAVLCASDIRFTCRSSGRGDDDPDELFFFGDNIRKLKFISGLWGTGMVEMSVKPVIQSLPYVFDAKLYSDGLESET